MTPRRVQGRYDWGALLRLIRTNFAFMEGRIDPPSSANRLTEAVIEQQASTGEVWVIEDEGYPIACMFLTFKPGRLYLGKLAVAASHRGRGLARRLLQTAETRARDMGLPVLELETRVELTENHAAFAAMGFRITGESRHPGYAQPTSLTLSKPVR